MGLIKNILDKFEIEEVSAHCDIPCGIYDPHLAQVSAHSVLRMTQLIDKLERDEPFTIEKRKHFIGNISRYIHTKEESAETLKHEVRILWGDYFKPEHLKEYPELHQLVWDIMKIGGKAKQETDIKTAEQLLEKVQKLAEIFWKTKGLTPIRVKAPYPSGGEIVLHK